MATYPRRWRRIVGATVLTAAVLASVYVYRWYHLVYTFARPLERLDAYLGLTDDSRYLVSTVGRLDDEGFDELTRLMASRPEVKDLRIAQTQVTDDGLRHLARLPNITHLDLSNMRITDAALVHVGRLQHLQSLSLEGDRLITGSGLIHLASLRDLSCFSLRATGVSGHYIEQLAGMHKLKSLDLGGTELGDDCLHSLGSLTSLEELWLDACCVSDDGISSLRPLTQLRVLHLAFNRRVTDASIGTLGDLMSLRELVLPPSVSAAGAERLRKRLPHCTMHLHLGVIE
jgi:internalin A